MPSTATLATFLVAAYVLLVIPGPAVTFVVARSVQGGRAVGIASVLGVHAGALVWVAASATGLAALLMSSVVAFSVVKYLGAAYLIYLGVRALLAARGGRGAAEEGRGQVGEGPPAMSLTRTFRQGVVVSIMNPKLGMFFVAFLPQFLAPGHGSVTLQIVVLGALFIALGLLSDGAYAMVASAAGRRLRRSARLGRPLDYLGGVIYLGLGVFAAVTPAHASSSK